MKKKIVLAFSGGLDTSFCVPFLKEKGFDIDDFDALTPAMEAGSAKSVNIVLMGHFAKHTEIPKERWIKALEKVVKPQFLDMNLKAFDLGFNS